MKKRKNYAVFPALAAAAALGLAACLGINSDDNSTARNPGASIRLVPISEPTRSDGLARRGAGNTAEGLESFQVAISAIQLLKDVELSGTGWNNPQGFFPIYENRALSDRMYAGNPFHTENAAVDSDFIDFMSPSSLARLATTSTFTQAQVDDYNYVAISWTETFRVRAAVALGDGDVVYTKTGTYDSSRYQTTASSSMFTGPAETVNVVHPNGGTFFRFLKPLSIKQSDLNTTVMVHDTVTHRDSSGHAVPFDTLVAAGQLSVMLIFNPEGFISAWDSTDVLSAASGGMERAEVTGPGGLGNIRVPPLNATAVPYRQGQEIWRETYIFDAPWPESPGRTVRTRLELYLVENNIVAVNLLGLSGEGGGPPMPASGAFFVEDGAGGSLNVENWDHSAIFSDFHRQTEIGAGGTTDMNFMFTTVPGASYSLVEKRKMN